MNGCETIESEQLPAPKRRRYGWCVATKLKAPFTGIYRQSLEFYRDVRQCLLDRGDVLTPYAQSRIQDALYAYQQSRMIAQRQQKREGELSHEQWLAYGDKLLRHREALSRALKDLGLDREQNQSIRDILFPRAVVQSPSPTPDRGTATKGVTNATE